LARRERDRDRADGHPSLVIAAPDEIDYGEDGEVLARKRVRQRTLEVVHDELGDTRRVITVLVL
jgi:hypothetical protein